MPVRSALKTVYHIKDGPVAMYVVDAKDAVERHPKEWSYTPWQNGVPGPEVVEIPSGWEDLKPSERITLAVKLGAKRIGLTAAKADEYIEAKSRE